MWFAGRDRRPARLANHPDLSASATRAPAGLAHALRRYRDGDTVRFLVDNPKELTVEEHPYAIELNAKLRKRGIAVRGFRGA